MSPLRAMPPRPSPAITDTCNASAPVYMSRVHALPALRALVGRLHAKRTAPRSRRVLNALQSRLARAKDNTRCGTTMSPFDRMNHCRMALERLDANGWKRSYHQRLFHEDFLVCFLSGF